MRFKIKSLRFSAGRPVAILNHDTAKKLNIYLNDRILIKKGKEKIIAVVDLAEGMVSEKEIAVSQEVLRTLHAKQGNRVSIKLTFRPESIKFIHKKLSCQPLKRHELKKIIKDIVDNAITEAEIAFFVSAIHNCGMSIKEIGYLIKAIADTGKTLHLKGKIADKHSIGGVAGNRTTPIVISICSSTGLIMPKSSSRAITSAAATADVVESIAKVEFTIPELYKIIKKTNACLVWGSSLGLAPADSKIIQIEKLLHLDPEPQLLASILAKKLATGSRYVLIDIPYGKSAKVSKARALHLKKKFEKLAKDFNIHLKCILTNGTQPIGNGIGPILEIKDIVSILRQDKNKPLDLEAKSLMLSGLLLELTGKAKKGKGKKMAKEILQSGKAYKKFKEIIKAQKGNLKNLQLARLSHKILAEKSGKIVEIDNKKINLLARILGCPSEKRAGIYLHYHKNAKLNKGIVLMTFYAQSKAKLKEAVKIHKEIQPIKIRR